MKSEEYKRYCCAKCGAELNKDEYMVNLAPLVFMGMSKEHMLVPVYISRSELDKLVKGKPDKEGYSKLELTPSRFLEFAYGKDNEKYLKNRATSVEKALEAMETKLGLRTVAEEPKEKETSVSEAKETTLIRPKLGSFGSDENVNTDSNEDEFCIPGFTEEMSAQAVSNFSKGNMDVRLKKDNEYGISFSNLSYIGENNNGVGDGRQCPYCKGKILKGAHDKTQFLIGIVGFQAVGKSCLIAALCEFLLSIKGESPELAMPEEAWEEKYNQELKNYRQGCTVEKTEIDGHNTYNPSIITKDIIWTFVDVPGEAIQDPKTQKFNIDAVVNRFKSIKRCDAYIFCASYGTMAKENENGQVINVFGSVLDNVDNKGRPVLFVLTQEDEEVDKQIRGMDQTVQDCWEIWGKLTAEENSELKNCVHNLYAYYKETKFVLLKHSNAQQILERLATNNYITAITCSAYGFQPVPTNENKKEKEKSPEPKNIQTIIEWVQKLYGIRAIDNGEVMDGHMLQRDDTKRTEKECEYISRMFVNPSDLDKEYYEAIAGGFLENIKVLWLNLSSKFRRKKEGE